MRIWTRIKSYIRLMLTRVKNYYKSLQKYSASVTWIEERPIALVSKLSLLFLGYVILAEPILFQTIVKSGQLAFLNNFPAVFLSLFCFQAIVFGVVIGKRKSAVFSFIDLSILLVLIITTFYGSFRYVLYPLKGVLGITYVGVLYLMPLTSIACYLHLQKRKAQFQPFSHTNANKIYLSPDHSLAELHKKEPEVLKDADKLKYHDLATELLEVIKSADTQKAFSIGIDAVWGSGKSSLFDILQYALIPQHNKKLDETKKEIVVITFSPWLYPDQNSLVRAFFRQLEKHISGEQGHFDLDQYVDLVVGEDSSFVGMTKRIFFPPEDLEKIKVKIGENIKSPHKTYLIIIDDLDRLEAKEILEVGRLCRIIADFPNTIYLLGYDRAYIDEVLEHNEGYGHKASSYFDKVVQFELRLPHVTEEAIAEIVNRIISLNGQKFLEIRTDLKQEDIVNQLAQISDLRFYKTFLPTLRDAKRFCNALIWRYISLSRANKIDFKRVMLLELVFYKLKGKYELLYSQIDEVVAHSQDAKSSEFRRLFDPITDENFKAISKAFNEALVGLLPIFQKSTLETYFSYFNSAGFSGVDVDYLLKCDPLDRMQIIEDYWQKHLLVKLFLGFLQKFADAIENDSVLGEGMHTYYGIFDIFKSYFRDFLLGLSETEEADISSALIFYWHQLSEFEKNKDSSHVGIIQSIRGSLFSWPMKFASFDPNIDPDKIILTTNVSRNLKHKPDDDDSSFNKIFDLSQHSYTIEFLQPEVLHWRLGFKFSPNDVFPICTGFRLVPGFPLFHLGRDHGSGETRDTKNVRATFYNKNNTPAPSSKQLNDISFVTDQKIRIKLSASNDGVQIAIWAGAQIQEVINTLPLSGFKFCKLYAWADNDSENKGVPYNIEVVVTRDN